MEHVALFAIISYSVYPPLLPVGHRLALIEWEAGEKPESATCY